MKILVGHNYYQQPGGEDAVVRSEIDLLRSHGHEVLLVEATNKDFNDLSMVSKISNVLSWSWSERFYHLVRRHCLDFHPDVAHFHNTFFMMTPSVYAACRSVAVPVVQTLHNFRLLCSNALLYRQGHACEECLSHSLSRGISYGCYRNSRVLTWAVVRMLQQHRQRKTGVKEVDAFIALTDFARDKFVQGGLPKGKIWVKPNFLLSDPGVRTAAQDYFVFAGRLSEEKGVMVLLESFKDLPKVPLVIMGDGPLRKTAEIYIKQHALTNIRLTGFLDKDSYYETLKKAKAIIVPSVCYENFPVAILEAFACGVPVVASGHGAMRELVRAEVTGVLFNPGDACDLKEKISSLSGDPQKTIAMGLQARKQFEEHYSAQSNYKQLMSIYDQAKMNTLC